MTLPLAFISGEFLRTLGFGVSLVELSNLDKYVFSISDLIFSSFLTLLLAASTLDLAALIFSVS
ncbi:TPA: hypothetical protein ACL7YF_000325 [Streptococcus pneumoniae]